MIQYHDGWAFLDTGDSLLDHVMEIMTDAFDPFYGEAWNRHQCNSIMGLPGVYALVVTIEGEPAGFLLSRTVFDECELLLLAVKPEFRREGVATALFKKLIAKAKIEDTKYLHLEVREKNPALNLYYQIGFREVGRRINYYKSLNGDLYNAITLRFIVI
ncbi:GNAT family N-acetyltransferase [Zymomonas mobilis]|uniref:GNAT family N-acetyltransferase n=1 Tax=Zymomonas mobilis TaxID=542 RepID=UPI0003C75B8D|nr:GNAT family N-acetyltransferase [Zymomonas mobilis]AHB10984.1 acetyltransferase [Zymomonas mobilis subsp. mobilis str. CP4 = NRRL B-14023]AHJ71299.1 ribosomal-protein-alanine N-acetyltransferase [Zymomonas mobilis subsp. mobilis NRRL B-12526]AHJ73152.1 ribosomal-protein-alanine N-acetyltransferase [Zymomonas mobilis subsp. mobilis str. CP4 = NRRL B-14023]TWE25534.1 ribosomal-protein-alanine N-acetyltransferase [Zymomonas mobilis]